MAVTVTMRAFVFALAVLAPLASHAQVKIGFITTLSGPGGYLGQDARDGFLLAIEEGKGSLGGTPVTLMVEDDGLKPGQAKQIADRYLKNEGVKIFTGTIFTNVQLAYVDDVLQSGAFFISNNAGSNDMAGRDCHPHYFTAGWDELMHFAAGVNAKRLGFKRMMLLAPNYQAGKESIAAFKRGYGGEVVGEIYTRLDQSDFAADMAQIRSARPDGIYQFHPGGLGISFIRQFQQAGLVGQVPMAVAAPAVDGAILRATGDAAIGIHAAGNWNSDFPNPASRAFVAAYTARYNRPPTFYAAQAYDVARLIGSALAKVNGNVGNAAGFRAALAQADFASVRGRLQFDRNQQARQDWYALEAVAGTAGPELKTGPRLIELAQGPYAAQCKMP